MVRPKAPINFLRELQFPSDQDHEHPPRFQFIEATLTDEESLQKAVSGIDAIIHLAGNVSDWGPVETFHRLNVLRTEALLHAAAKAGVRQFIFMSSLTVHGMRDFVEADENTPRLCRRFPYGETKILAEDLVTSWAKSMPGRQGVIIRPAYIIYGRYDKNSFIHALHAILRRQFAFINGGRQLISHVYVENLCEGIRRLLDCPTCSGAYNVIDGNMTWRDWTSLWTSAAAVKPISLSIPYAVVFPIVGILEGIYRLFCIKTSPPLNFYRINIPRRNKSFSRAKLERDVGFTPPIPLESGIKATLEFYRHHSIT